MARDGRGRRSLIGRAPTLPPSPLEAPEPVALQEHLAAADEGDDTEVKPLPPPSPPQQPRTAPAPGSWAPWLAAGAVALILAGAGLVLVGAAGGAGVTAWLDGDEVVVEVPKAPALVLPTEEEAEEVEVEEAPAPVEEPEAEEPEAVDTGAPERKGKVKLPRIRLGSKKGG